MWIDTTKLPDRDQRAEPLELIGQVIGTAGTAPYVHLQLEMSRQLFGTSMPTLVANDGVGEKADQVRKIAEQYGADFVSWESAGHAPGDLRIFYESLLWAEKMGLQIIAKFSRRSIPLISWRHGLQYLAATNTDAAFFTRRHLDVPHGLFRTDAIAYRVRAVNNDRFKNILKEAFENKVRLNVEATFDTFSQVMGGWAMWDLLGPNFYKPWKNMMQWRGLLPYHYGDLSRQLNLPYTDVDFLEASFGPINFINPGLEPEPIPRAAGNARVIQQEGHLPLSPEAAAKEIAPPASLQET